MCVSLMYPINANAAIIISDFQQKYVEEITIEDLVVYQTFY